MFVDLLYKMTLIYYYTLYLQKMIFDIMIMLNLTEILCFSWFSFTFSFL